MSVLGFYKEKVGSEEIIALIKGDQPDLYVEIPSEIRNRMEIVVGNRMRCVVKGIVDKEGNPVTEINQETIWEIIGYWHELYIPPEDATRFELKKNDYIRLILKSVVRADEEVDI